MRYIFLLALLIGSSLGSIAQQYPNRQELPKEKQIDPQKEYAYLLGDSIFFTDKNYKAEEKYYGVITRIVGVEKGNLTVEINNGQNFNNKDFTGTHTFYLDELEKGYSVLYYWILHKTIRQWKSDYLGNYLVIKEGKYYLPKYQRFFEFDLGDTIRVRNLIYNMRASTTEKHEDILELGFFFSAVYRGDSIYLSPEYILEHSLKFKDFAQRVAQYQREDEAFYREIEQKYGSQSAGKIMNGEYWLGMNKEEAYLSLGDPAKLTKTFTYYIFYETWKYSFANLYFENGMLMSWK